MNRLDRTVEQRQALAIPLLHASDYLGSDLLRRLGHPDVLVHVSRPLRRAHPHHRPLRPAVVSPAALACQPLAYVVPHLLGLDQDPVEIEDHRFDHKERYLDST